MAPSQVDRMNGNGETNQPKGYALVFDTDLIHEKFLERTMDDTDAQGWFSQPRVKGQAQTLSVNPS